MKNRPTVTAIVLSYNHSLYVEEAIHSILNQTYRDFELLVLDDASTDNSAKIIQGLASQYGFYFEQNKYNAGIPVSLNRILLKAKGKYIAICASDDKWLPDKLEKQVKFMEHNPHIASLSGNKILIDENGKEYATENQPYFELDFDDVFIHGKSIGAPGAITKKDIIDEVGGFDENIEIEDAVLWLRITHAGYKLASLSDVLVCYRRHRSNLSKSFTRMIPNQIAALENYKTDKRFPRAYSNFHLRQFAFFSRRDKKLAFSFLKKIRQGFFSRLFCISMIFMLTPRCITNLFKQYEPLQKS